MGVVPLAASFFERPVDVVARDLIGTVIVRELDGRRHFFRIVETEAYFDESDPASWARFGKRKDNWAMWGPAGTILIKNVHKYLMLNVVCGAQGEAGAVLIRALEPLNSDLRCSGPGLLSLALGVSWEMNGVSLFSLEGFLIGAVASEEPLQVGRSKRIGVSKDLAEDYRFFALGNSFVSK